MHDLLRFQLVLNIEWEDVLLAAYLELLLLHYYGVSQDDEETPAKRQKLEKGSAKLGRLSIITPVNPAERGCQLSVRFSAPMKSLRKELDKRGVVVCFRGSKIKTNLECEDMNEIRSQDLCDTGAVFHQLSYEANWELVLDGWDGQDAIEYMKDHIRFLHITIILCVLGG